MGRPEQLIGILGKAGHGKDAVARVLVENHGYARRAFADALKEDCGGAILRASNAPHTPEHARCWIDEHKHIPEIRTLLQHFGQAQRVLFGEDYWVDRLFAREWPLRRCLVIPDVRFPNEAKAIKARGGTLIRVVRPGHDNGLTPEQQSHPSETALDGHPADYTIENDGSLDDLANTVKALLFYVL